MLVSMAIAAAVPYPGVCAVQQNDMVEQMGISVSAEENREYSFTDKKSGFWYEIL